MNNMLYSPETKRISALVDFDWAAATHPAHEFFTSFHDVYGTLGRVESEAMREAVLSGDFDQAEETESWQIAQAWDAAVKKHGGTRPSDVKGIRTLDALNRLADALCPFHLGNESMVKRMGDEKAQKARAEAEEKVRRLLDGWDA